MFWGVELETHARVLKEALLTSMRYVWRWWRIVTSSGTREARLLTWVWAAVFMLPRSLLLGKPLHTERLYFYRCKLKCARLDLDRLQETHEMEGELWSLRHHSSGSSLVILFSCQNRRQSLISNTEETVFTHRICTRRLDIKLNHSFETSQLPEPDKICKLQAQGRTDMS